MIACPRCTLPAADAAGFCSRCGAPLDEAAAVPLAQLIDERARALFEESKAAERRAEEEQQVQLRFDGLQASVERARAALKAHWMPPRGQRVRGVPSVRGLLRMSVSLSVVYAIASAAARPDLDWTPAGAAVVLVEGGLWLALMIPLLSLLVRRNGWAERDRLEASLKEAKASLRAAKEASRGRQSAEAYR